MHQVFKQYLFPTRAIQNHACLTNSIRNSRNEMYRKNVIAMVAKLVIELTLVISMFTGASQDGTFRKS